MSAFFKAIALVVLLSLLVAFGAYAVVVTSAKTLDAEARKNAPGSFLETSQGTLHYRWHGPEDGVVIVMAHGFSTPNFIFEQNASSLAKNGFRVLTFDHFGRGWSDRPAVKYTPDFYDRALLDLANGLNLKEPFGLVGLSMGGPITAEFTARHPERVSKLFLFVPAGFKLGTEPGSNNDRLLRTPILGDWVWRVFGKRLLLGDAQYEESHRAPENRLAGDVSEQMKYAGYFEALLSSYRNYPMHDLDEVYQRVESSGVPVHAVFGAKDQTVLIASADRLKLASPSASQTILEDGEHGLNYQMNAETNQLLRDFFSAD